MSLAGRLRVNSTLLQSVGLMYGAAIASGLLQYVSLVLMARNLGPHGLGLIVLTTTIGSFTAAAVEFGISPVLVRFRPEIAERDRKLWAGIVAATLRVIGGTASLVAALALGVLAARTVLPLTANVTIALCLGLAVASPTIVFTYCQGYLQAHSRFRDIARLNVGLALSRLALIVLVVVLQAASVASVLTVYLLTIACATALAWKITIREARLPQVDRATRHRAWSLVAPYLRWTMLGRATVALNGRFDIFLLSALAGAQTTGVYAAAWQSAAPFPMLATTAGEVTFPHFAAKCRAGDSRALIQRWFAWLPVLIAGAAGSALAGALLLPIILGNRFAPSAEPFLVLVLAYGIQIWIQPVAMLLYASDRQRSAASIAVAQTVALGVLDVVLIPRYGAMGPALAILITVVLSIPLIVTAAGRHRAIPRTPANLADANT
jgi:O-antigen/teichoic acid export membrane protein